MVAREMTARTRLVAFAVHVYSAALITLPRHIRDRYGDAMRDTFAEQCRDASARGTLSALAMLARELMDLAAASARERWRSHSRSPRVPQSPSPLVP